MLIKGYRGAYAGTFRTTSDGLGFFCNHQACEANPSSRNLSVHRRHLRITHSSKKVKAPGLCKYTPSGMYIYVHPDCPTPLARNRTVYCCHYKSAHLGRSGRKLRGKFTCNVDGRITCNEPAWGGLQNGNELSLVQKQPEQATTTAIDW